MVGAFDDFLDVNRTVRQGSRKTLDPLTRPRVVQIAMKSSVGAAQEEAQVIRLRPVAVGAEGMQGESVAKRRRCQ